MTDLEHPNENANASILPTNASDSSTTQGALEEASINDDGYDYDKAVEARCAENEKYLDEFEEWLMASGLKEATINRHLDNVYFFLNTYLVRDPELTMEDGCGRMDDFLGFFFIRKCMWSTPTTIKQNAASFKKFYKCMVEKGHVNPKSYAVLLEDIKQGMPDWIADCEAFNDPNIDYFGLGDPFGGFGDGFDSGLGGSFGAANQPFDLPGPSLVADVLRQRLAEDKNGEFARGFLEGIAQDLDSYSLGGPAGAGDLPSRQEAIKLLYLAILYLSAWEERGAAPGTFDCKAWPDAGVKSVDELKADGLLTSAGKGKPLTFTNEGLIEAETVLTICGLEYLLDEDYEDAPDAQGTGGASTTGKPKFTLVPNK